MDKPFLGTAIVVCVTGVLFLYYLLLNKLKNSVVNGDLLNDSFSADCSGIKLNYKTGLDYVLVTIIVIARNEEANILNLLECINKQNYPKELIELIVVDDCSEDSTYSLVDNYSQKAQFRIELLSLKHKPEHEQNKKSGIAYAIDNASGDWVICTDADCVMSSNWVKSIIYYRQKTLAKLIIGPVQIKDKGSFLSKFQALDFTAMQAFTACSASMKKAMLCNGANLAYERSLFLELKPYNNKIISGDDMFLLYEAQKKYPEAIHYLACRESIVKTEACKTLTEFINQRIRWGGKVKYFRHKITVKVMLLLFFFNVSIVCFLLMGFSYSLIYLLFFVLFFYVKMLIDKSFVTPFIKFFRQSHLLSLFLTAQFIHLFYMFMIGVLANVLPYQWKGRLRKV